MTRLALGEGVALDYEMVSGMSYPIVIRHCCGGWRIRIGPLICAGASVSARALADGNLLVQLVTSSLGGTQVSELRVHMAFVNGVREVSGDYVYRPPRDRSRKGFRRGI